MAASEPLTKIHSTRDFDCEDANVNRWLKRFALQGQSSGQARSYVIHESGQVIGFYAIASGSIQQAEATERTRKGLGKYPIPIILLAQFGVDKGRQGKGLGKALLKEALVRCLNAADEIGARAVVVDASSDKARTFYEKFGFERSPVSEFKLMILMKDLRASAFAK